MIELPIAECMKEHYKEQGAEFTDSERATIFWNSWLPIEDKLNALREIHDTTKDEILKDQIKERLKTEDEVIKAFMYCDDDYVHLVILDDCNDAERVFVSVEAAIAFGKEECDETFRIRKEIIDDRVSSSEGNLLLGGCATFKKDGTLFACRCYNDRGINGVFLNCVEPQGFEEAFVPVLNPFEYGDIVRIKGDSRPAIVMTSQERWNETRERIKKSEFPLNYYRNTLTVEFLYSDGEFEHGHPDIFDIEKLDQWDNKNEWDLLRSISRLMKGEGWIEAVFDHYIKTKDRLLVANVPTNGIRRVFNDIFSP